MTEDNKTRIAWKPNFDNLILVTYTVIRVIWVDVVTGPAAARETSECVRAQLVTHVEGGVTALINI